MGTTDTSLATEFFSMIRRQRKEPSLGLHIGKEEKVSCTRNHIEDNAAFLRSLRSMHNLTYPTEKVEGKFRERDFLVFRQPPVLSRELHIRKKMIFRTFCFRRRYLRYCSCPKPPSSFPHVCRRHRLSQRQSVIFPSLLIDPQRMNMGRKTKAS